jgi:hypothetical protein
MSSAPILGQSGCRRRHLGAIDTPRERRRGCAACPRTAGPRKLDRAWRQDSLACVQIRVSCYRLKGCVAGAHRSWRIWRTGRPLNQAIGVERAHRRRHRPPSAGMYRASTASSGRPPALATSLVLLPPPHWHPTRRSRHVSGTTPSVQRASSYMCLATGSECLATGSECLASSDVPGFDPFCDHRRAGFSVLLPLDFLLPTPLWGAGNRCLTCGYGLLPTLPTVWVQVARACARGHHERRGSCRERAAPGTRRGKKLAGSMSHRGGIGDLPVV